jgi:hypothetical protein
VPDSNIAEYLHAMDGYFESNELPGIFENLREILAGIY